MIMWDSFQIFGTYFGSIAIFIWLENVESLVARFHQPLCVCVCCRDSNICVCVLYGF